MLANDIPAYGQHDYLTSWKGTKRLSAVCSFLATSTAGGFRFEEEWKKLQAGFDSDKG